MKKIKARRPVPLLREAHQNAGPGAAGAPLPHGGAAGAAPGDEGGRRMSMTWTAPDGSWGMDGVDLAALPPKVYAALRRLAEFEREFGEPVRIVPAEEGKA